MRIAINTKLAKEQYDYISRLVLFYDMTHKYSRNVGADLCYRDYEEARQWAERHIGYGRLIAVKVKWVNFE